MKTATEYLNSRGFYNTNVLRNTHDEEVKITDILREYALEAIKADRERVFSNAKIKLNSYGEFDSFYGVYCAEEGELSIDKQSIINLPIELK